MSHSSTCPDEWEVRRTAQREARNQWWGGEPQRERYEDCDESNRQYRTLFEAEREEMRQEEQRREDHEREEAERERQYQEQQEEEQHRREEEEAYYGQLAEGQH